MCQFCVVDGNIKHHDTSFLWHHGDYTGPGIDPSCYLLQLENMLIDSHQVMLIILTQHDTSFKLHHGNGSG